MKSIVGSWLLFLIISIPIVANAETLFSDDFQAGLGKEWIFSERGGADAWKVVEDKGGNKILQKTGSSWTIISVDGVASLDGGKEIWATAKIRCDVATADEGTELGVLIDPAVSNGNWYFAVRAMSGQAGFDELAVAWHDLVPYDSWSVGDWHYAKVAVIGDIFYGKVWLDGDFEPADWITKTTLTSHLDQDGVGFAVDTNEVSFDDLVVSDDEAGLVLSVDVAGKLPLTWGNIKMK